VQLGGAHQLQAGQHGTERGGVDEERDRGAHGTDDQSAMAGPAIRARLKIALFSAIAFGKSARPTISTTNVCLVGLSTAVASPRANASAYTCTIRTVPVTASHAEDEGQRAHDTLGDHEDAALGSTGRRSRRPRG